jgi:hypothetical protein
MSDNKDKIRIFYKKIQEKKNLIENAQNSTYATDGVFRFGHNTADINIKAEKRTNVLRDIVAFLLEKEKNTTEANHILGLKDPFTWLGVSVETWIHDIKIRLTQINVAQERLQLSKWEEELLSMDTTLLEEIKLAEMEESLNRN